MRKVSVLGVLALAACLAMAAWWSLLAAERAALRATESGAERAAIAAAVAVQAAGGDAAEIVALTEQVGDLRLLVRDADGDVVAGSADPGAQLVETPVPGTELTLAAEVPDAGLGVGRFSHVIILAAFVVMAATTGLLGIVTRAHRRAEVEVDRLGRRWQETAAADDLTGLGNRTRLLEDTGALIARGSRYGNAFGLAMFELDADLPDVAVQRVAETLVSQARGADLCYRIDDRRFVTVLPEQDETGATLAADRIRRVIAEQGRVEVRTGVSSFSPWLPCAAGDLLGRAELDLGAAALVAPEPVHEPVFQA
jgi:GGDEF domain-containing protein